MARMGLARDGKNMATWFAARRFTVDADDLLTGRVAYVW